MIDMERIVAQLIKEKGVLLAVLLFLLVVVLVRPSVKGELRDVQIGDTRIQVSVADDDKEREQGLSGVSNLPENEGKLFIFQEETTPGFWMKDMAFPLDIIWISKEGSIVALTEDLSPSSYPDIVSPPVPVTMVLEVNAGFAQRHGIHEGQFVTFKK